MTALAASAQTIAIEFAGETATVTIPEEVTDVTSKVNGAYVTLTSATITTEYTYTVSGKTTNGGLTINGEYKLTLDLAGADITSKKGAAIDVECGKRIAVNIAKGTENNLVDCVGGKQKAAMYFSGHPEFTGGGTLNVTGNTKHAISAKEYLQIKKKFAGNINILSSASDGIHCGKGNLQGDENEFFIMSGGTVTINNVLGDCIDADDFGCMNIEGGTLNLNVSALDCKGLKCSDVLTMTGGTVNIKVTGDASDAISCGGTANLNGGTIDITVEGNGAKGIKCAAKLGAGDLNIDGTDITINATGGNYIIDEGLESETLSPCVGIKADGNITQTSGEVNVVTSGDAVAVVCAGTVTGTINQSTGIQSVTSAAVSSQAYSISGQPVGKNHKGIVIKNGKKTLR